MVVLSSATAHSRVPAGPSARRLARELGIEISQVAGSGSKGRIDKRDVKQFAKTRLQDAAEVPARAERKALPDLAAYGPIRREAMTRIAQATGANMQRAWQEIPHAWLQERVDITELEAGRQRLKSRIAGLTLTAIICKAMALTVREHPRLRRQSTPRQMS